MQKCQSVARCLLHLLCVPMPSHMKPTQDTEVHYYTNYTGADAVDNALRRLLTNNKLWWNREYLEMVQKGAAGILAEAQLEELRDALAQEAEVMTVTSFKHMADLMDKVKASVRSQKLSDLEGKFCEPCTYWL